MKDNHNIHRLTINRQPGGLGAKRVEIHCLTTASTHCRSCQHADIIDGTMLTTKLVTTRRPTRDRRGHPTLDSSPALTFDIVCQLLCVVEADWPELGTRTRPRTYFDDSRIFWRKEEVSSQITCIVQNERDDLCPWKEDSRELTTERFSTVDIMMAIMSNFWDLIKSPF